MLYFAGVRRRPVDVHGRRQHAGDVRAPADGQRDPVDGHRRPAVARSVAALIHLPQQLLSQRPLCGRSVLLFGSL